MFVRYIQSVVGNEHDHFGTIFNTCPKKQGSSSKYEVVQVMSWIFCKNIVVFDFRRSKESQKPQPKDSNIQPCPCLILRAEPTVTSILKVQQILYSR